MKEFPRADVPVADDAIIGPVSIVQPVSERFVHDYVFVLSAKVKHAFFVLVESVEVVFPIGMQILEQIFMYIDDFALSMDANTTKLFCAALKSGLWLVARYNSQIVHILNHVSVVVGAAVLLCKTNSAVLETEVDAEDGLSKIRRR